MKYSFLLIIVLFLGCYATSESIIKGTAYPTPNPPNGIKISENFYGDETEISNADWKEYLYWLANVYGNDSVEYYNALPDTLVHREELSYGEPFVETYFQHPSYDQYPIVGVNLKQAKKYSEWRTERVAEMMLLMKGLIKVNAEKNPNTVFTIQRYQEGDFDWIVKKDKVALPKYTIPTSEEWEKIAGIEHSKYGLDSLSKQNKRYLKKGQNLYPTTSDGNNRTITSPTRSGLKNINGLYGTIGNVAELVDENIVKGGSFKDPISNIEISKNTPFEKPTNWIGFRNVCTYEIIEIK